MSSKFKFERPDDAIAALASRLSTVGVETDAPHLIGRTLARDVVADRDSPAADVSAMDGYAVRLADVQCGDAISVSGESAPGAPPPGLSPGRVVRIFTGAIVPVDSEAVIKREDTEESDNSIRFRESALGTEHCDHIRRAGENAKKGSTVLPAGTQITAAGHATMANFGAYQADVHEPVRVSIITSGDEVGVFDNVQPEPWQLRNSNRSSITSLLSRSWIQIVATDHCQDDSGQLADTLHRRLSQSDAVILTGGVSMGDYDYVPEVVQASGGEIVFHGLPIRPGKPILGAATAAGKLILGLPGNPVSATIGGHRFAIPLLAKLSGQVNWQPPCPAVRLDGAGDRTIPLHWLRLVCLSGPGVAVPVISRGSGDLVSLGASSGYVEIPPGEKGSGPWPYHAW
jgi:molybdopterin molybdotransferase